MVTVAKSPIFWSGKVKGLPPICCVLIDATQLRRSLYFFANPITVRRLFMPPVQVGSLSFALLRTRRQ